MKTIFKTTSTLFFALGTVFILGLAISSCSDDEEVATWQWPGLYVISNATLQTQLVLNLPGAAPVTIPKGTDITALIGGGILGLAPCTNKQNGAVDLRSNNELYFSCVNETVAGLKAGTWQAKDSEKSLSLTLAIPQALLLKIEDVTTNETTKIVDGVINNFPLSQEFMMGFVPAAYLATLTPAQITELQKSFPTATLINMDIQFTKK